MSTQRTSIRVRADKGLHRRGTIEIKVFRMLESPPRGPYTKYNSHSATSFQIMKRGFLLKAADKKKGVADKLNDRPPKESSRDPPSDNLTEKNLPDHRSFNEKFFTTAKENLYKTIPPIRDDDGSTEWVIRESIAEGRVLSSPGYPARIPKPRLPDLYEVRTTPDMGQGVFAKNNIKRGEIIFSERPLLVAPNWVMAKDPKIDLFTTEQRQKILRFEEEKSLEFAVQQRMNENNKALYMALHNSHTADGSGPLLGIMRTNGFGVRRLTDTGQDGPRLRYTAVCTIGSRLNHSCIPNVMHTINIPSFSIQFTALRDIKAGEQLYHSYCDVAQTKAERQTELAPYGFTCSCLACVNATPASDNLRKTFQSRVSRLDGRKEGRELWADLVSGKQLEAEMVAEGLDVTLDFFTVMCVLHVAHGKLGMRAGEMKYQQRIRECSSIHVHGRPELQQFLRL